MFIQWLQDTIIKAATCLKDPAAFEHTMYGQAKTRRDRMGMPVYLNLHLLDCAKPNFTCRNLYLAFTLLLLSYFLLTFGYHKRTTSNISSFTVYSSKYRYGQNETLFIKAFVACIIQINLLISFLFLIKISTSSPRLGIPT